MARQERARKHPVHRLENLHHRGAVQRPERQDLCSNILWGEGEGSNGAERPAPFLRHGFVGVFDQAVTPFHFCERGVKTGARVCQEGVLQEVVRSFNTTLFSGHEWVFQQDPAPAQKVKTTQEWLRRNVPAFISAEDWPSGSPDLKTLDYELWAFLEDMACRKRHNNLEGLKRSLVKAATYFPLETVRVAIAPWTKRLKACVEAEGGHFEWCYYK